MMKFESLTQSDMQDIVDVVSSPTDDFSQTFLDGWSSGSSDDLGVLFNDAEMGGSPSSDDTSLDQNIGAFDEFPSCKSPAALISLNSSSLLGPRDVENINSNHHSFPLKGPSMQPLTSIKHVTPLPCNYSNKINNSINSITAATTSTSLNSVMKPTPLSAIPIVTSGISSVPTISTIATGALSANPTTTHNFNDIKLLGAQQNRMMECKLELNLNPDSGSCSPDSSSPENDSISSSCNPLHQKIKKSPAEVKRQQSVQSHRSGSFFDILTAEERGMMEAEGVVIPADGPLTKLHERELKRLRRQIKNKYSAKDSRRKRKEYIESLEAVNNKLGSQVSTLNNDNNSLRRQLRSIKKLIQPKKIQKAGPSTLIMLCLLLSRNNNNNDGNTSPMDTTTASNGVGTASSSTTVTKVTKGDRITLETAEESNFVKQNPTVFSMADSKQLLLKAVHESGWDSIFHPGSDMAVEHATTFEPCAGTEKTEFGWTGGSDLNEQTQQLLSAAAESSVQRMSTSLDQVLG